MCSHSSRGMFSITIHASLLPVVTARASSRCCIMVSLSMGTRELRVHSNTSGGVIIVDSPRVSGIHVEHRRVEYTSNPLLSNVWKVQ